MRHSEMDIKTQIMTQECQAGRAEQALQFESIGKERIAAARHFKVSFAEEKQKAGDFEGWSRLAVTSASFYEVGLQGRILRIVTIFQDSEFWEALQYCDKPNLKNCDR